jgi:hypothetical protein
MTEQGLLKVGIDYGNSSAAVGKVGGKDTTKGCLAYASFYVSV